MTEVIIKFDCLEFFFMNKNEEKDPEGAFISIVVYPVMLIISF